MIQSDFQEEIRLNNPSQMNAKSLTAEKQVRHLPPGSQGEGAQKTSL
jgi:hypothetical protein